MADHTHIEWTDATWNIITGCSVVSAGCKHCYAMKLAGTRLQHDPSRAGLTVQTQAGPVWNGQVRFNEKWLDQPLRWKRPRRIFVCAHGDLFHESVPEAWIDQVFAVMAQAPQHTFQVLTKRPERMLEYLTRATIDNRRPLAAADCAYERVRAIQWKYELGDVTMDTDVGYPGRWPLPNVWLGVSVEDQAAADERIPLLLQCPAAVRWISAEPLLGSVDLTRFLFEGLRQEDVGGDHVPPRVLETWLRVIHPLPIDWVVAGGESGPGARPMHPDWARSLRDQCGAAGVAFMFKQWGAWGPIHAPLREGPALVGAGITGDTPMLVDLSDPCGGLARVGKKAAGRLLDGVQHDGYPVAP